MTAAVKTIREISIGVYDGPHATPELHDEGAAVFLGIPNLLPDGRIDVTTARWVAERDLAKWTRRVTPQPNDIVFTYEATLNRYAIIPEGIKCCLGRRTALIRPDQSQIDHRFLFYYFFSPRWRAQIEANTLTGATVDRIPLTTFPEFEVLVPDLQEQKRIAEVLSAYDDLIATNQRRIALLEDAARRLYREWFVHLRFPGHESVPVKDGVPEGWLPATFADLVEINPRTPFAKDIERPFVEMSALSETSMVIGQRSKRVIGGGAKFKNGDTLFARITPCTENGKTGFVQFLEDDDLVASGSTEFIVLRSSIVNPWWVYCMAREDKFREHAIRSMAGSDGRQRVNPKCFDQFNTLQPPKSVLEEFEQAVKDSFAQIEMLCNLNAQLAQARDLLLPKLMSGQLDVSGIRLPDEVAA